MNKGSVFTSESVSEGHPDKVCDQISDAILDAIIAIDPNARVACETLVKTGMVLLAGEITTSAEIDYEQVARQTILDIGYNSSDVGFDGASCAVLNVLGKQSPDIAMGVDEFDDHEQGAGDQGIMFGFASNETDVLMPAPITYAHLLMRKQAELRKNGQLKFLRPDAKSQVTFRYDQDGVAQGIEAVVLSTQHDPDINLKDLQEAVMEEIIKPVCPPTGYQKTRSILSIPPVISSSAARLVIADSRAGKSLLTLMAAWLGMAAARFQARTRQKLIVARPMRADMLLRILLQPALPIAAKSKSLMLSASQSPPRSVSIRLAQVNALTKKSRPWFANILTCDPRV